MINQSPFEFISYVIRNMEPLNESTSEITLDTAIGDLNLDSLDRLELVMAIEDEYNVNISDDVVDGLLNMSIRDVLCLIPGQELVYGRG